VLQQAQREKRRPFRKQPSFLNQNKEGVVRKRVLIGVISDTHDNRDKSRKAVEIFNQKGVDLVLHAGDFISPFNCKDFSPLKAKFIGVFGNNDGDQIALKEKFAPIGKIFSEAHRFEYLGKRFILMHQPILVEPLARSREFDVIVYGHTHSVDLRRIEGTLLLNPGECGGWLHGRSTVAVLNLETMEVEILDI